jgi:two-component system, OmpR family, phosphate regulon sensor histidine kinase PhoR
MADLLRDTSIKVLRSLRSLDEEYARSEALFSSIGTGAIATDEYGKIYRINDAALEILGFNRKDLIGKWFTHVVKALDMNIKAIDPMDRPIVRSFLSGKPVSEKMYYETKNKRKIPVLITVSPILVDKKPIGAVEVFRDISIEFEIDKMKSEFISIASHQLRTPLAAINTYANMLFSGFYGNLSKEQKESMSVILTSVDRMNGLITALLDISQLEAGRLNVNLQTIDLKNLLAEIMQEQMQTAMKKKIKVKTESDLPTELRRIECDPLLLGEVYNNLISNAIKYTPPKGKVTIKFSVTKQNIIFSVKDTGYGIPKELQPHIFTKFYRADNIRKIDTTGTGLGLYMVRHIADVLKGKIWFESNENKGSTFYFSLPRQ